MLKTNFLKLKSPEHPLLGPNINALKIWGLWRLQKNFRNNLYNALLAHNTIFLICEYIELYIIRLDIERALRNLSFTMLSTITVYKAYTFIIWQKHWEEIMTNASSLERAQLDSGELGTKCVIAKYTKYSRCLTYFYWCLTTVTAFIVTLSPLIGFMTSSPEHREFIRNGSQPYPEILSAWMPYDKSRGFGYEYTIIRDCLICSYGSGIVATFDSNAIALMIFFAGQLKILQNNCANIFRDGTEVVSDELARQRIRACHYHHIGLIKYSKIYNSLLSPVMFVYVIICSLMICASAIQLMRDDTTSVQRIWIAEYLVALIAQLLLYCWHGNEVLNMSEIVEDGVYASNWWSCSVPIRRSLVLLGGQLRKQIVFTAGWFTNLNVPTFIAILKGSYSYFTLLSKKQSE